ncbi:MAG: hypothetical protein AUG06_00170 [Actinobacteria bacterium 13_1_20CM_2_65_11]|nr:MAG: hypothetical protein AUG06_00170 [Actinobacteria bacterium 13_1_20CM_2_65_11]
MNAQTADLASPALEARTLHGLDEFMRLERDWRRLVATTRSRNPFLTWEWVSTWLRHFCAETLVTVVVTEGEQVVGIAPFHRRRYQLMPGVAATALQLLAPSEIGHLFEIREVLTAEERRVEVVQALLTELEADPFWDWVELSAYGPDVHLWHQVLAGMNRTLEGVVESEKQVPLMTLMASWEDQRSLLKRNIKESIRHCYNSLKREDHAFAVRVAVDRVERASAISSLFELHRLRSLVREGRWHTDHFNVRRVREFLAEALEAMAISGSAALQTLRIDGELAAVRATMEAGNSLYLYYSGFDPRWWRYGVMTLMVTQLIQGAIERGLTDVNFSPGVDDSKTRWGVKLEPLLSMAIVRRRPGPQVRRLVIRFRKWLGKRAWRAYRSASERVARKRTSART